MAGRHGSGALLPVGCGARGGGLRRHAGGAVTEVCEFGPTLASRNRVPSRDLGCRTWGSRAGLTLLYAGRDVGADRRTVGLERRASG